MNGFEYQIKMKVLLGKQKENGDREFTIFYFISTAKTVIRSKYVLDKSFQEMLHILDNWNHEGSAWIIEHIDREYITISIYSLLSGSTYIKLPD